MAAIITGQQPGASLDGVPGSHQLVKDPGDGIVATWPVNNVGDALGYARIRLDILQINVVLLGDPFVITVGGGTAIGNFGPIAFPAGDFLSALLILDEVDSASAFIQTLDTHPFVITVTSGGGGGGPILSSGGEPSIF